METGLVAEQPQDLLSVTNMAGRGSGGEEPEGSLHWCLYMFRKSEPGIPKMGNWAKPHKYSNSSSSSEWSEVGAENRAEQTLTRKSGPGRVFWEKAGVDMDQLCHARAPGKSSLLMLTLKGQQGHVWGQCLPVTGCD